MRAVRCILVVSHADSVHAPRVRWDTSQHLGGAPVHGQRVLRSWQGGSARGSARTRKTTPTLQWSQNRQGHSTLQMVHSVHAAGLAEAPEPLNRSLSARIQWKNKEMHQLHSALATLLLSTISSQWADTIPAFLAGQAAHT
ncbi:hypothetical protein B0H10DRAFT_1964757 [Mycena sp. CBHHK59/15]|nr:hypothetical protein B0H10DRAFT_1964757 [Mycena sp. CBHHK59/15]